MKKFKMYGMVFVLSLFLAACGAGGGGGDGGGNPPGNQVSISQANAQPVAQSVFGYLVGVIGIGGIGNNIGTADTSVSTATSANGGTNLTGVVGSLLEKITDTGISTAAEEDISFLLCESGSAQASWPGTGDPGIGDPITILFTGCEFFADVEFTPGLVTLNGTMIITVTDATVGPPMTISAEVDLNDFGVDETVVNGDMALALSLSPTEWSTSVSGNSLSTTGDSVGTLSNYSFIHNGLSSLAVDLSPGQHQAEYYGTLNTIFIGGSVDFNTVEGQPFVWDNIEALFPFTGVMKITGANNSYETLDAATESINTVLVDVDGDPVDGLSDEGYPTEVSWLTYLGLSD